MWKNHEEFFFLRKENKPGSGVNDFENFIWHIQDLISGPGALFTKLLTQNLRFLRNFKCSNAQSRLPMSAKHLIQALFNLL